jgi:hypothetical protein
VSAPTSGRRAITRARELCAAYYERFLRSAGTAGHRERRSAVRYVRRALARCGETEYYLMLADLYVRRDSRMRALLGALRVDAHCAEAHAELALLYARHGDRRRCEICCRQALRWSSTSDVEDVVLHVVVEGAQLMGLARLAARAYRRGRRRFPRSALFRPDK